MDDARLRPDPAEPLAPHVGDVPLPDPLADLRGRRVEFSSRGDRVPMRLLLPVSGGGPFPLVLLQHGAGGAKDADYLDATAGPWVRGGAAVASIDFPLHGERHSGKLTETLLASLASGGVQALEPGLWSALVRQAVCDLQRGLDALARLPEVDAERVVYAAFSLGTLLGAPFLAVDTRPRAAALAVGGGGFGPPETDPARYIGRVAPRPLFFVNAESDERIPREAAERLHAAASEPKQVLWVEGGHRDLRGATLKAMWRFLQPHLGL